MNAGFSTITGLAALAFGGPIDGFLGTGLPWLVRLTGIGLLGFAAALVFIARMTDGAKLRAEALAISVADLGWVAGTAVLISLGVFTSGGAWLMAAIAVDVMILAVLQLRARQALEG